MNTPTPPAGYTIESLDASLHEREQFTCGDPVLDAYLKTQANQKQSRLLAGTHVLLEIPKPPEGKCPVVGFLTLVTESIPIADCPEAFKKITNQGSVTAMLLARMAVHSAHKGKGLGAFLVQFTFASAVRQAEISGCPVIVVDAKPAAVQFYPKFGFIPLPERPTRMIVATRTARAILDGGLDLG